MSDDARRPELLVAQCSKHTGPIEPWITCVHVGSIETARLVEGQPVVGEAVCPACRAALGSGRRPASLRLACGACVRARWPIEGEG